MLFTGKPPSKQNTHTEREREREREREHFTTGVYRMLVSLV